MLFALVLNDVLFYLAMIPFLYLSILGTRSEPSQP
jgi:hypothetical protein